MKKDLNYIAALEKAIGEKYGQETTINPKALWDLDKEKEYIEQIKEAYKKESLAEATQERIDLGGVLIAKKLINKTANRQCEYCKKYSFNRDDDIYLTKFSSCQTCYIKYFEGRK